jgi:hypothetical protein
VLCDFETSKQLDEPSASVTLVVATHLYTDPAVLRGERPHTKETDLYALGMMFCEILSGKVPDEASNVSASISRFLSEQTHLELLQSVSFIFGFLTRCFR